MSEPPGHIPGYHIPNTLIPMGPSVGAIVAAQQAAQYASDLFTMQQAQAEGERALLLLLMHP
jgi:hypothetical protein